MRRELVIGIVSAWCCACGESRSDGGELPGAGATGGVAGRGTGGSAGVGGTVGGAGGSVGGAGVAGGSGGATGGGAGAGGAAGSSGGAAGAGMPGACPGTTNHAGGTRIRPRFAVTSEGVRAWVGWHDTTLDLECQFNRAADGLLRCLPNNWDSSEEYFTDTACTEAAYTPGKQDLCTFMPYIMTVVAGEACVSPSGYEFHELGEAVLAGTSVFRRNGDGVGCSETVVTAETQLFRRGAVVPSSTFMPATSMNVPGVGRIGGVVTSTEDGLRQLTAWTDGAKGNVECRIGKAEDGVQRCVPTGKRVNEIFTDATCSINALEWTTTCDLPPPAFAIRYPGLSCSGDDYAPLAVGAELSGPAYARNGDDACVEKIPDEPSRLYQVTPVPPTDFLEVTERVETSAPGRLQPRYHTTADGGCWFNDFWDAELMVSCWFTRSSRNEHHCLPAEYASVTTYYTDSACTQGVAVWDPRSCAVTPAPRFVSGMSAGLDECAEAFQPLETSPFTGAAYTMVTGTCTLVPDSSAALRVTPVELSRFVAGTVTVE